MSHSRCPQCTTCLPSILQLSRCWLPAGSGGQQDAAEEAACNAGIARCTIHMGDVRQGRALALQSGSEALCRECAQVLEGMGQLKVGVCLPHDLLTEQ